MEVTIKGGLFGRCIATGGLMVPLGHWSCEASSRALYVYSTRSRAWSARVGCGRPGRVLYIYSTPQQGQWPAGTNNHLGPTARWPAFGKQISKLITSTFFYFFINFFLYPEHCCWIFIPFATIVGMNLLTWPPSPIILSTHTHCPLMKLFQVPSAP
jgi:hypothetical protein